VLRDASLTSDAFQRPCQTHADMKFRITTYTLGCLTGHVCNPCKAVPSVHVLSMLDACKAPALAPYDHRCSRIVSHIDSTVFAGIKCLQPWPIDRIASPRQPRDVTMRIQAAISMSEYIQHMLASLQAQHTNMFRARG
jgi:hypothetical protein